MNRNKNTSDTLAQSMDQILTSEEHQNIFQFKPKIAKASSANDKSVAQQIMDLLLKASATLDDLGLDHSSIQTLQAARMFQVELHKLADFGDEVSDKYDLLHPLQEEFVREDVSPEGLSEVYPEITDDLFSGTEPIDYLTTDESDYPVELELDSLLDNPDEIDQDEVDLEKDMEDEE